MFQSLTKVSGLLSLFLNTFFIKSCLHFQVSLCVITLWINFTTSVQYIKQWCNINNKDSCFKYYEVDKNGRAWSNSSLSLSGLLGFGDLPTVFDHINILKEWFFICFILAKISNAPLFFPIIYKNLTPIFKSLSRCHYRMLFKMLNCSCLTIVI